MPLIVGMQTKFPSDLRIRHAIRMLSEEFHDRVLHEPETLFRSLFQHDPRPLL
jgi:hypothetical protein